jgi:hypothetical protein
VLAVGNTISIATLVDFAGAADDPEALCGNADDPADVWPAPQPATAVATASNAPVQSNRTGDPTTGRCDVPELTMASRPTT